MCCANIYCCINSTAKPLPADSIHYIPSYCPALVLCVCVVSSNQGWVYLYRGAEGTRGEKAVLISRREKKREEVCVWYLGEKDNGLFHGRKEAHVVPLTDKVTQNCGAGSRGGLERQASISPSQGSGL